jgi:amino acid permease
VALGGVMLALTGAVATGVWLGSGRRDADRA